LTPFKGVADVTASPAQFLKEATVKKAVVGGLVSILAVMAIEMLFITLLLGIIGPGSDIQPLWPVLVCFVAASLLPGILAAWWLAAPRTAGRGASVGALANLVAGTANTVLSVTLFLTIGVQMTQARHTYQGEGGAYVLAFLCLARVVWLPVAVGLGALSGALFASLKKT
jgi:hypothetical protein